MNVPPKVPKNPPPLQPGMDNPWYDYAPFPARPKLAWPKSTRVAFCVVLTLEYYELLPAENVVKDSRFVGEFGNYTPDYRTWTQREYGNRTGIFRVLDVLDRYQIRAGVAVNAMAAERYPFLIEQLKKRKYEFIAHGVSANRMISSKMSEEEERSEIGTAIAEVEKVSGVRPKGWLGQEYGESQRTPQLLADAGLDYVLDWPNDDQPYPMKVGKPFVSMPNQPEWDDVQQLWLRRIATPRYPDLVGDAFERLHQEGGQVFNLSVHPWLMGMAHRIKYLDEALRRIERFGNIWQATPGEIAQHYRTTMM
ncbi:MAG: polysaccharide deacetylase family protein [Reyranella sp.]|uniref:polysaccharide deacetylase family protein n=1 Tax=Reyranella sp. TaxID=1929291 RepID=UPI001AD468F6|nr:polysaccharide deacetylase family protein [Reyranella sp.]MBN9091193.1 polysaccharide deacetylase family protein [Reyranella sp.]